MDKTGHLTGHSLEVCSLSHEQLSEIQRFCRIRLLPVPASSICRTLSQGCLPRKAVPMTPCKHLEEGFAQQVSTQAPTAGASAQDAKLHLGLKMPDRESDDNAFAFHTFRLHASALLPTLRFVTARWKLQRECLPGWHLQ